MLISTEQLYKTKTNTKTQKTSSSKYLNLGTLLTFWARSFFALDGCSVPYGMLSSTSGLCLLDARSNTHPQHPDVTIKNVSRHGQMSPGRESQPLLRTTALAELLTRVINQSVYGSGGKVMLQWLHIHGWQLSWADQAYVDREHSFTSRM